jgi:hypothetical protein
VRIGNGSKGVAPVNLVHNINKRNLVDDSIMETVDIAEGESLLFAYGSLLSQQSLEETLGVAYRGPRIFCELEGWRRVWDGIMPNEGYWQPSDPGHSVPENIVYLNIRAVAGSRINGILYVLTSEQFALVDEREWVYTRTDVTSALRGVAIRRGRAFAYVAKHPWLLESERFVGRAALRRSYLDLVEDAVAGCDAQFGIAYRASTEEAPPHLIFCDVRRKVP